MDELIIGWVDELVIGWVDELVIGWVDGGGMNEIDKKEC